MEFFGLLGNEELKSRLSVSFRTGKYSHCYLISGPEGSGKKTLARAMAQAMQCEESHAPCGSCNVCRKIAAGIHPDVITVDDPEKKTVSVDLIRQLQADAFVHPNEGKKKIYLIPRAQDMTENAQNALLKLIEEPPSYAVFFLLTTNAGKMLSTVRSRSVELRMEPVSFAQAQLWLQEKRSGDSMETLQSAHLRCGGFLGQMLTYLSGEIKTVQTTQFAEAFAARDPYAMTLVLSSMEKMPRDQLLQCFSQWKQLLTQALSVRAGLPGGEEAAKLGRCRTAADLAQAAQLIQKAMEHCAANIGAGHVCGWLAANL